MYEIIGNRNKYCVIILYNISQNCISDFKIYFDVSVGVNCLYIAFNILIFGSKYVLFCIFYFSRFRFVTVGSYIFFGAYD